MFARRLRLALLAASFAVPTLAIPVMAQTPQTPAPVTAPIPGVMKPGAPVAPSMATPRTTLPAATSALAAASSKVNINNASAAQLDALPGVGPARAKNIIKGRPYASLDDLVKKKVLTKGVFEGARNGMALASINTSSASDLAKTLPGIGEVRSKAIVAGRPYAAPTDLVAKGVLTQGQFDTIAGLITN